MFLQASDDEDAQIDTEALENVVRRMVDVFSITSGGGKNQSKFARTLAGRKSTTVRAGDTVLHITISETVSAFKAVSNLRKSLNSKVHPASAFEGGVRDSSCGFYPNTGTTCSAIPYVLCLLGLDSRNNGESSTPPTLKTILADPTLSASFEVHQESCAVCLIYLN